MKPRLPLLVLIVFLFEFLTTVHAALGIGSKLQVINGPAQVEDVFWLKTADAFFAKAELKRCDPEMCQPLTQFWSADSQSK